MAISNQIAEADFYMTDLIFTVDRNGSDLSQSRMRSDLLGTAYPVVIPPCSVTRRPWKWPDKHYRYQKSPGTPGSKKV
jgi:hypothetical protein